MVLNRENFISFYLISDYVKFFGFNLSLLIDIQSGALTLDFVFNSECEMTSAPFCVHNVHVRLCYRPISVPHLTYSVWFVR